MRREPLVLSEVTSITEGLPLLEEADASYARNDAKRFLSYTKNHGEAESDFYTRCVLDILVNYYSIPQNILASPLVVSGGAIPGLSVALESARPNYASFRLTMDFPTFDIPESHSAIRLGFFSQIEPTSGKVLVPSLDKELPTFFSILPSICSCSTWQKSSASSDNFYIYEALLVSPSTLNFHFAADSISRFLEWARAEHSYSW